MVFRNHCCSSTKMPSFSTIKRTSNRQPSKTSKVSSQKAHLVPKTPTESEDEVYANDKTHTQHGSSAWAPSIFTAFKLFASIRLCAAMWGSITDCDEVYNYWEPLHLLLYGSGFQTWEYSPTYAIRSYAYIWLYALPAKIYQALLPSTKITTFFVVRCLTATLCAMVEVLFYRALLYRFSSNVARLWLLFQLVSSGMFIACCAFLPSSFSMVFNMLAMACWLHNQYFLAVFLTAVSALVGWPFSAVLGLPIVVDMLWRGKWKGFFTYSALSGMAVCTYLLQVDTYYFGNRVLAPLNIILYNIFSKEGPNLYGTEPFTFYIWNMLLNYNVAFLFALVSLPVRIKQCLQKFSAFIHYIYFGRRKISGYLPMLFLQAAMALWLMIFFKQAHKEERFLFPIYPLVSFAAAVSFDGIHRLQFHYLRRFAVKFSNTLSLTILVAFLLLSVSRCLALYKNYSAPFTIYMSFIEQAEKLRTNTTQNVCVGKEWYRFPSSFFLPDDRWKLRYVKSEFKGILPKPYAYLPLPASTSLVPTEMNDQNLEEPSRYFNVEACNYIVDLHWDGMETTVNEPDYTAIRNKWKTIVSVPFLVAQRSHKIFRAFYVPFLSEALCYYGNYSLFTVNAIDSKSS